MKKFIFILLIIFCIFILFFSIFSKQIILFFVKKQLANLFRGSAISIRACTFRPFSGLAFYDVEIKDEPIYKLKAKEINIHWDANFGNLRGEVYLEQVQYQRLTIKEIKGSLGLEDKGIVLTPLSMQLLGGEARGSVNFSPSKLAYQAEFNFSNLDLRELVRDFELAQSFQATGRLGGRIVLSGKGIELKILDGDLSATEAGGTLNITDKAFLENLARYTKQSFDILVESFKNYHYNIGRLNLSLDKGNLVFEAALDGEAGRRNLNIVLHNFKLGG